MASRAFGLSLAFCLTLGVWLYFDVKSALRIDYEWHNYLYNATSGRTMEPRESYDLAKVINVTDGYINKTNAMERLYDLQYNMNIENPFSSDQIYSDALQLLQSGWPVANKTRCASDLKWIGDQLDAHRDYALVRGRLGQELTQLVDSYGKPESGLYTGTVFWVGSYKQCKKVTLDGGRIKTRYCYVRLRPKWWPQNETMQPKTRIRMGVCLPETCDTMSFNRQKRAIETLVKFDLNQFYKDNLELDSLFCLPDERSPMRRISTSGFVYMYLVASWLVLVVVCSVVYELIRRRQREQLKESLSIKFKQEFWEKGLTVSGFLGRGVYDPSQKAKSAEPANNLQIASGGPLVGPTNSTAVKLLQAISIHESFKKFKTNAFRDQQVRMGELSRVRVDMCCMSFIKFAMALLVVLGHSGYLNSSYSRSFANRIDLSTQEYGKLVLSLCRCVDTFFFFFAILTSYTLLRKFTVKQLSSPLIWVAINAGVMFRIGPVYMLVYYYSKLVSVYMGDGPWWDYGVYKYSVKAICMKEPWWKSIPYLGRSGSPPVASCVLPAWFLVSYAQLCLVMPMITYILYKLPNRFARYFIIGFATAASSLQLALKMYQQTSIREDAFAMYGGFLVDIVEKFQSTGTMSTLGRVGCVTLGCYVGYLLKMYETGEIREWPRWFRSRATLIITSLLHVLIFFLPLIAHVLTKDGQRPVSLHEFVGSFLVTLAIWPMLNGILFVNAVTVYNRTAIVRFFSHSFWHSANKLGFCIYLVHWEVMSYGITSFEQGPSLGFMTDIMKFWSVGVFFSIVLAMVIHIMFEAPIANLLMILVQCFQKKHPSSVSVTDSDDQKRLDTIETPNLSIR